MQEKSFRLKNAKIGPLPIIQKFLEDIELKDLVTGQPAAGASFRF